LTRIFENAAHGIPDKAIELIHANLWIVANPSAVESVGVAADAAIVGVPPGLTFGGRRGNPFAVERIATASANDKTLQQVQLTSRISRGQATVPF
jgi:arginase family enzyme